MKNPKFRALAAALILITAALVANRTMAYYTVLGTATNVVTSGSIQLQILETTTGGKPFPEDGVSVIPGDVVDKAVFVRNDCDHPFWLRAEVVLGKTGDELPSAEFLELLNLNAKQWIYVDGYYYYYRILQPGEITEPLFTQVRVNGSLVDQYDVGKLMSLTVKASAVQSEHNPAANPWQATGWPEA